jgi:hypothetical protein
VKFSFDLGQARSEISFMLGLDRANRAGVPREIRFWAHVDGAALRRALRYVEQMCVVPAEAEPALRRQDSARDPSRAWLKPKPRQREVDANDHREDGNYPHPSRPNISRRTSGEPRSNKAYQQCTECGRRSPPVPVHRWSKKSHRRIGNVARMMRTPKHDAERWEDGEQGQILCNSDYVENRECRSKRKYEAAKPVG